MPDNTLSYSVGAGRKPPGNNPKDCEKVRGWLESVPAANGGTTAIKPGDLDALAEAIRRFQRKHVPTYVDGWIQPGGLTWGKIIEVLKLAPTPVATGGTKDFKPVWRQTGFKQWDEIWIEQTLNASSNTLHAKGCLLTCLACALAWKGVTLPADPKVREAVRGVLLKKIPKTLSQHDGLFGPDRITPATLEAWMSLNSGQGYAGAQSSDLKPSLTHSLAAGRADLAFWGQHSSDVRDRRFQYLDLPTPEQLRRWLDKEHILIAKPIKHASHWLWLTGHDGAEAFSVWDVGYMPKDADFTKSIRASDILVMKHWGSTASLR